MLSGVLAFRAYTRRMARDGDAPGDARRRISRRALLAGASGASVSAGLAAAASMGLLDASRGKANAGGQVPFWGAHQSGIATPPQRHLYFAALDFTTPSRADVAEVLQVWSAAAGQLCAGRAAGAPRDRALPPADSGEAADLGACRLTITFGFGPTLFESRGDDRYRLSRLRPPELAELPVFPGDRLDPERCGGDLAIQACADDPQVAFHAVRNLTRLSRGVAALRWAQAGFRSTDVSERGSHRNLMGFRDGANNLNPRHGTQMARHVWASREGPAWIAGGTYAVVRRIRFRLDQWDRDSLQDQSRRIGRDKTSGAPLGAAQESDAADFVSRLDGQLVIPADAHIRLASPASNEGARLLRRSYSFAEGTASGGGLSAGLFFICFQRDPRRQFVPIQQRLAQHDALNRYISHTGSAVFAYPPGVMEGDWVGRALFDA
jgi:deferrochelatase/peroxidase EfeB